MILLDTNVLSALMADVPDQLVIRWLDREPRISIWTTSVNVFEIKFGLNVMPEGKRRRALEVAFQSLTQDLLENRIASFDALAAQHAAKISARQKSLGHNVEIRDTMIAGIASATKARLATRNLRDFQEAGVGLLSPWDTDPKLLPPDPCMSR